MSDRSVAWLSLEEDDKQPASLWTYVITALSRVIPGVGVDSLALLSAPQPQIQNVLATLLNELSAAPADIHLVLDDYHLVDGPDIGASMTFLLEHLPPKVHLVISTRADPPFRCHVCGPVASSSRSARATCASRPPR
jgi:LuxR family maltose regulon positive regulatory protein